MRTARLGFANPHPSAQPQPKQALAYYSVFLETGFALLIYGDLLVMGLHGIVMDVSNVLP